MSRLKICFIGSGNLATRLSIALSEKGFPIVQVYSQTETSAFALSQLLNCSYTTNAAEITTEADLYICALKDSVIDEVLSKAPIQGKMIVHTAGSVPMSILEKYTTLYGVFYPLQTFSKNKNVDFSKIPLLLEGSLLEVVNCLEDMGKSLSENIYFINSEERKRVHIAAVFASNFTNHLYALSEQLLAESGLPFDVLLPLIDETAQKVHKLAPKEAQTGPAIRYDRNVIDNHSQMLNDNPDLKNIYSILSQSIHKLSEKNN